MNWHQYDPELLKKPAVIAANKVDVIQTEDDDEDPIERLKNTFEPEGLKVFPVSAASNQGLKELFIPCMADSVYNGSRTDCL